MIIDTHSHLPPLKEGKTFQQSKEKLLSDMNKSKVDYSIIIPDNVHNSKIGDLEVCVKLLEGEKTLFLIGTIDVRIEGKEWTDRLDLLFKKGKIKGIKIFPGHDPIYPTDKRLIPIYKLCLKYGLPIVIHTGWNSNNPKVAKYNDPKHIVKVAKKYPQLKIVISHYFWPDVDYCYKMTRGYKNIYFDTSALADKEVVKKTGLKKIRGVLEKTVKDNPKSVLFGTDYAMCDIKAHINLINHLNIPEENKEWIFWKNAFQLFKLKINPLFLNTIK